MAPPVGTVMATEVEDWVTTAACPRVSPGRAAMATGQYVRMFQPVATISSPYSRPDIERMAAHTFDRSVYLGRTTRNTPNTTATKRTDCRRRPRRGLPWVGRSSFGGGG